MRANEFFKKVGIKAVKSYIVAYEDHLTDELKRLVESHELVGSYGGIPTVKTYIKITENKNTKLFLSLKQAIADVESCQ